MNRSKILFFFLFFLIYCESFQAQDTVLLTKATINSTISYDPKGLPENAVNNAIIREIAEDLVKRLNKTRLVIRSEMNTFLLKNGEELYIKVFLDSFEFSGDHFYRKISFSDVMKPSSVIFTLQIRSVQDSLIINEFKDIMLAVKMNDSVTLPIRDGESYKSSAWLAVSNIRFIFNEDDLLTFNQRQRLIDDYYASAAIADSLEPVMRSMDFRRKEFYPEYFIRIEEIGKLEQLIRNRNFDQALSLDRYDPKGLASKCYYLLRFTRSSAMTLESALDTIPVINSRLSEDSLIIEYLDVIKRYIRWSFLINERNSGIYSEFLDRFYEMNAFDDDERILIKLIGKVYPIINPDSIFSETLVKLKKTYQKEAEELTERSLYAEAIGLLDHLRRLEDKYIFLKDTLAGQGAREKAAYGIYSSYIGVAENSISIGKSNIAKWYLDKAYEYALSNPDLITTDSMYRNAHLKYQKSALDRCDELKSKGDFDEAINCYSELAKSVDSATGSALLKELDLRISMAREGVFHSLIREAKKYISTEKADSTMIAYDQALSLKGKILDPASLSSSIDSLKPVTERYRYAFLITEIDRSWKKREFSSAYDVFRQAKEIAAEQHIESGNLLDSLYRMVFPKYIEEQVARARPLIWTNQFLKAQVFADSIDILVRENGFSEDPGPRSALDSYKRKISERICWNASEHISTLVIRAHRNALSGGYIKAVSLLDSALIIANGHPGCNLLMDPVRDTLAKYSPAKQYQEMLIRIDGNVSLGDYDGFVVRYLEAGWLYEKNTLHNYGLTFLSLYDYLSARHSESLTLSVCNYFLDAKNADEAFTYLKLLSEEGFPVKYARTALISAGEIMAVKDYNSDPTKDPIFLSGKYAEGNEWFDIFVKSYLRYWKKLETEDRR